MRVRVHYSPLFAKTPLKLAETRVRERGRNRTGFSIQRIIYEIEILYVQASGRFLLRRIGDRQTNEPPHQRRSRGDHAPIGHSTADEKAEVRTNGNPLRKDI